MTKNLVEELRWRGMIHDMMPGTEEQLQKEMTAAYIGFDPVPPRDSRSNSNIFKTI